MAKNKYAPQRGEQEQQQIIQQQEVVTDEPLNVDLEEVKAQATDFLEHYQRYIIGAFAALVLLVGGTYIYKNFIKAPKEEEAAKQLYKAEQLFRQDSFTVALKGQPGTVGLADIAKKYSGTQAGNLASYYAGVSYLKLGQYPQAIEFLENFDAAGTILPSAKYGLLGDAYSETKKMDEAVDAYKKAASSNANEATSPYYLYKLGLLQENLKKYDAAKEAFEQIKTDYPSSPQARGIDAYIARVDAEAGK